MIIVQYIKEAGKVLGGLLFLAALSAVIAAVFFTELPAELFR